MNPLGQELSGRQRLRKLFDVAVAAAQPSKILSAHLPPVISGRTVVIGAGKASAAMAAAFEHAWIAEGRSKLEGVIVTQYGYGDQCRFLEIIEANHPVPDENGVLAAQRIFKLAKGLGPEDQLVALMSGGGSALLCMPPDEIGLEGKRAINAALLRSGASISEMNCVRKHFSLIKGGRLAVMAFPARVTTLVLSDIPGDAAYLVASGPTIADPARLADAREIVARYAMKLPSAAKSWLARETAAAPLPDQAEFSSAKHVVIGNAQLSLEAAAAAARESGYEVHILSDRFEGEARDVGRMHAAIVRQILERGQPFARPCILLSGGETTVTLRGKGKGGRNAEFLLGFACGIEGCAEVCALAADTDGRDGSEDNAGAFCDGNTVSRLNGLGQSAQNYLHNNDAWSAFAALDDLIVTGPTRTNVNDFRAILIS